MAAIDQIEDEVTCDVVIGEQALLKEFERELGALRARTVTFDDRQTAGALKVHDEIKQLLDSIKHELDLRDELIAKYAARDEGPEASDVYSPAHPYAA